MNDSRDPQRLRETAAPNVCRVLVVGRAEVPNEKRMAMLTAGIVERLGLSPAGASAGSEPGGSIGPDVGSADVGGGSAPAAIASGSAAAVTKIVGVALVIALVGLGGWALVSTRAAAPSPSLPETASASAMTAVFASVATASATTTETFAPPIAAPSVSSALAPRRSANAAPSPSAGAPPPEPSAEIDVLRRAQRELSTRPRDALASCDEHARRFPAGALGQEREVVAIDALVRLGRRDDAAARARRFFANYPTSGHRPRVEALVAQ